MDDDRFEGKWTEIKGRLQNKLGKTKDEVRSIGDDTLNTTRNRHLT